jgi:hypothetical protein
LFWPKPHSKLILIEANSYLTLEPNNLLLPTLITLSGVGTTCFHHVVTKIRKLFLRLAGCLMSTLLETGAGATISWFYCKLSNIMKGLMIRYGQQHLTLYTCSSILALMPLKYKRYKVQSVYIVLCAFDCP